MYYKSESLFKIEYTIFVDHTLRDTCLQSTVLWMLLTASRPRETLMQMKLDLFNEVMNARPCVWLAYVHYPIVCKSFNSWSHSPEGSVTQFETNLHRLELDETNHTHAVRESRALQRTTDKSEYFLWFSDICFDWLKTSRWWISNLKGATQFQSAPNRIRFQRFSAQFSSQSTISNQKV